MIQYIPELGVIEERPVNRVGDGDPDWVIEGGDMFSLLLNTLFALTIGLLSGSIMSLLVVKKSELISKIYTVAIIAIGLAIVIYVDINIGWPPILGGRESPLDSFDFSSLTVRGVTIGFISLLFIVLSILIILSISAFIKTPSYKKKYQEIGLDIIDSKEEFAEDISITVERALEELSRGDDVRKVIMGVYRDMCGLLEKGGISNEDSITPREFERRALKVLDLDEEVVGDITKTFEEARYSTHPLKDSDRERVLNEFKKLKREIKTLF